MFFEREKRDGQRGNGQEELEWWGGSCWTVRLESAAACGSARVRELSSSSFAPGARPTAFLLLHRPTLTAHSYSPLHSSYRVLSIPLALFQATDGCSSQLTEKSSPSLAFLPLHTIPSSHIFQYIYRF